MKTVLLTGANGFLGSHLLEALLVEGHSVVILKRSTSDVWRIRHLLERVKVYDVDLCHLKQVFEQHPIDVVIHTACSYGRKGESIPEILATNLMFGISLIHEAVAFNVKAFINTDTFFNSEQPLQKHLNDYTLSKRQFVEWLSQYDEAIDVINLKLQHLYGPRDDEKKFIPWIIGQLNKKVDEIPLTKGEQLRDFIYVDDVVSAYLCVVNHHEGLSGFSEFDVATGIKTSVKEVVGLIKDVYEKHFGRNEVMLDFGAIPYGAGELMNVGLNNPTLSSFGWTAKVSLEEGIARILKNQKLRTQ